MVERGDTRIGDAPKRYLTDEEVVADATGEGFGTGQSENIYNDSSPLQITQIDKRQTTVQQRPREIPYELWDNS
jgi:hypothetical protein